MPSTQQEVLRLSRDVESGRVIYQQLLNREQELSIARSSAIGNVRIIDPAVTRPQPVKPKKRWSSFWGFSGLFVSAGWITARSMLRMGIETPEQLEEHGINVYATVPLSEWLAKRCVCVKRLYVPGLRHKTKHIPFPAADNPVDLSVEAIRGLRTSLHFAMMESANNILMISGATPDSGKTFVSSTRRPSWRRRARKCSILMRICVAGMPMICLSSTIPAACRRCCPVRRSIPGVQTFDKGGFDTIVRGQIPPNPAELLMHTRFQQLLDWANERYDLVIIDTPPITAVTDAAVVGRRAGTTLLVARFGMNSVKEMLVCVQRLEQSGVNTKGVILNGVVKRASNAYGYGYHHYGYNYSSN